MKTFEFTVKFTLENISDDEVNELMNMVNEEPDSLLNVIEIPGLTSVYDANLEEIDPDDEDEDDDY